MPAFPPAPVGEASARRRPLWLRRVANRLAGELPLLARCGIDDPDIAPLQRAVVWVFDIVCGAGDFAPIGGPRRVIAEVGQALHRFAGRAHDEDAAALSFGAKNDPLAVGREGGLRLVGGRVSSQVERIFPAHSLQVQVPVAGRLAGIDD